MLTRTETEALLGSMNALNRKFKLYPIATSHNKTRKGFSKTKLKKKRKKQLSIYFTYEILKEFIRTFSRGNQNTFQSAEVILQYISTLRTILTIRKGELFLLLNKNC
jgi:hypothetical protein